MDGAAVTIRHIRSSSAVHQSQVPPAHRLIAFAAVRPGWTDVDENGFQLRQQRTGVDVGCPIVPELESEMKARSGGQQERPGGGEW